MILFVIAAVILAATIVGRYAFSIGSNEAATALRVNVVKWKIIIYSMAGLFVGVAAFCHVEAELGPARRRQGLELRPSPPSSSAAPPSRAAGARSLER
jgi:ribose/xylose/arabinose/galactoside ABC-type transport system permease subunit